MRCKIPATVADLMSNHQQKKAKQKKPSRKRRASQATRADPHELYQDSVQCVEAEIDFVDDARTTRQVETQVDVERDHRPDGQDRHQDDAEDLAG